VWCYIFPEIFRKLAFREGQDETSGNSIWSSLMRLLGYFSSFFCGKYERNDHSRLCDPKRKRCLSSNFRPWRRGWSTPTASPTPHASASLRWNRHSSSRWKRWSCPNTSRSVCWRKSAGRSWREQTEGATRSGEGIGKVFPRGTSVRSAKCFTWNILYWLACASHYVFTIGVILRE